MKVIWRLNQLTKDAGMGTTGDIFLLQDQEMPLLEEGGITRDLSKMSMEVYECYKILFLLKEAAGVKTSEGEGSQ